MLFRSRLAGLCPRRFSSFSAEKSTPQTYNSNMSSIVFAIDGKKPGSLNRCLSIFSEFGVNMTRIESKPAKHSLSDNEFYIDFIGRPEEPTVVDMLKKLKLNSKLVTIMPSKEVKWFPRRIKDLDLIARDIIDAGEGANNLQSDHPGFHDKEYRARRMQLAELALSYKHGDRIPNIEYSDKENATWKAICDKKHACSEYLSLMPILKQNCGYSETAIPQLSAISEYLKETTGFTIRPVAGLLSARNFLYGLAFRVFFSTQYIRHWSKPLYTPEPDVCHELIGHAPLFADKSFAEFSQQIGLASIGATDEQILQLSRCYWFSVEFGLVKQGGERKAYGAGLLSSFGELEYAMSDKPEVRPWNPFKACDQQYPITTYQPIYYEASSFENMKNQMIAFSDSLVRPFNVVYDPFSQSLNVDSNIIVQDFQSSATSGGNVIEQ